MTTKVSFYYDYKTNNRKVSFTEELDNSLPDDTIFHIAISDPRYMTDDIKSVFLIVRRGDIKTTMSKYFD